MSVLRREVFSRSCVTAGVVGFLAVGVLSGCSDGDAVTAVTSVSSSPAPDPSVTTDDGVPFVEPEKPQVTAGMKNNDVQGAKEAVEYFGKVLTYAVLTLDKSVIEHIEIQDDFDDCAPCISARRIIEDTKKQKQQFLGLEMIFSLHEEPEETLEGLWMARGKMVIPPYEKMNSHTKEVNPYAAEESQEVKFVVQYEKTGWKFVGAILP